MVDEVSVPRHMRSPGDDGYRTPTIEDAERTLSLLGVRDSPGNNAREVHTSALEAALQRVSSRATETTANNHLHHCKERDGLSLTQRVTTSSTSALSWKKRIRHITWAYFTLTMATGGLANVLYEGKSHLEGDVVQMLNVTSTLSLSGARHHRHCDLSDQHCTLSPDMGIITCQILLLSLYLQGFLFASHRVLVCPCIGGLLRHNPHQHLSIRGGKCWSMVN